MKAAMVRAVVGLGVLGVLAVAACEGEVGPTGPAGPAGATGPTGAAGPTGATGAEVFRAALTGGAEVPPSGSTATGSAIFTNTGGLITFRLDVGGINNVTAAHIHGPAAVGVNGPVRLNLYVPPAGTAPVSFTTTATLASGVAGPPSGISTDSLLVLLRNGNAYVNVHTTAFGGGEIRGQVTR